jgi:prepilin-type processing-associated H-X9-DG protein
MAGEKHVPKEAFGVGWLDNSAYNGDYPMCYTRGAGNGVGMATTIREWGWKWGSYHTAVVQFVFCDGHVRGLWRAVDPYVLGLLCVRDDGEVIPDYWSPP